MEVPSALIVLAALVPWKIQAYMALRPSWSVVDYACSVLILCGTEALMVYGQRPYFALVLRGVDLAALLCAAVAAAAGIRSRR